MSWVTTISSELIRRFAHQRRRIVAAWRIWVECRRIASESSSPLPEEPDLKRLLRSLSRRGWITPVGGGAEGVFRIDQPFAELIPASEDFVIQEANPFAVFSHLTALIQHSLTDQLPNRLQVTSYDPPALERIPLGTTPEDWVDLPRPRGYHPKAVGGVEVDWFQTKGEWDFGSIVGYSQATAVYVTDVERTLLDLLRRPDSVGGPLIVFRAWRAGRERLRLDQLIDYTERFGQPVLRQRVGYLLTQLGLTHPRLSEWQRHLQRGGSMKLIASEPYAPAYSAEWNISLNAPEVVLNELRDES